MTARLVGWKLRLLFCKSYLCFLKNLSLSGLVYAHKSLFNNNKNNRRANKNQLVSRSASTASDTVGAGAFQSRFVRFSGIRTTSRSLFCHPHNTALVSWPEVDSPDPHFSSTYGKQRGGNIQWKRAWIKTNKQKENMDMAYFFEDNFPGICTQNFCLCIFRVF